MKNDVFKLLPYLLPSKKSEETRSEEIQDLVSRNDLFSYLKTIQYHASVGVGTTVIQLYQT